MIQKAYVANNQLVLKWSIEDDGGLAPIQGVVEFSSNFDNAEIPVEGL